MRFELNPLSRVAIRAALLVLALCVPAAAGAETGALPEAAAESLQQAQRLAAEALNTYPRHFPDQPLWKQAIALGRRAAEQAPGRTAPLRFLAQVYTITGWYSRAWDNWTRYREAGGAMDAQARLQLAQVGVWLGYHSYQSGNLDTARRYYQTVYDLDRTNDQALMWLARIAFEDGRPEDALPLWQQVLRRHPGNRQYTYVLERVQAQLAHGVEAANAYYAGLEAQEAGRLEAALDSYQDAVSTDTQYLDALRKAGAVSLDLERPQLARDYWQRILTLVPKDAQAAYFLKVAEDELRWGIEANRAFRDGVAAYQKGDLELAGSDLAKATDLNPAYAEAWAWRGRLAFEAEDYQDASSLFQRAATLEPDSESYGYFARESARRLAGGGALAAGPAPVIPAPPPEPEPQPQPEPVQEAAAQEEPEAASADGREAAAPTQSERLQAALALPAPAPPQPEPRPEPRPEPEAPQPAPPPAEPAPAGPALVLLDTSYTHQSAGGGQGGAFAFFDLPDGLPTDLAAPVDYAGGTLYQRLEVIGKPSDAPVLYQLCLIPNDNLNVRPACSGKAGLSFEGPGVYQHSQPLDTFSGFDDIDWKRGLREAMLIVNGADGRPVDQRYAMAGDPRPDPELYYPMEVHYTAVLVPRGGTFPGWP